ncbi:hypothetical protein LO80_02095 [Candidatus Francisella endociliophora]|uniref:Lipoprotein n=1 Tax=Candidatus Francisella endociliophora TaxID=653937 RepID=A0A097ERR6_9GAMM|nr:hypothetical protein LO80_02095 [Francisella sp. FSC1006]
MFKQSVITLIIVILLGSCQSEFSHDNLWGKYNRMNSNISPTSSGLHSKLVENHNKSNYAIDYTPYGAKFR